MAKPLIYISYGMPKSGSTLAYRLISAVLAQSGEAQTPLPGFATDAGVNYAEVMNPATLTRLTGAAPSLIAVKTHSGLWNCVADGLNTGALAAHAICRDPRDIALSMMDAAGAGRDWGRRNGAPLTRFDDALAAVQPHARKFADWAAHPAVLALDYEMLAFDTEAAATRMAGQLRLDIDAAACARAAHAAPTQRNRAVSARWRTDLTTAENDRALAVFGDFIAGHCAAPLCK